MKRLHKCLVISALCLCLVCGAALCVACNGNKAVLTLEAGDGGTLATSRYKVEVGADVSAFLADVAVTSNSGFEFVGWYNGDQPLVDGLRMPKDGLTLTARYNVTYTAHVYLQQLDGSYGNYETRTGKAFYGLPFTYTPAEPHFASDQTKSNRLTSDALGVNEVFEVYLARQNVTVTVWNNLPMDSGAEDYTVPFGGQFETPDAPESGKDFRFAGWSTVRDGDVVYSAGESVTVEPQGDSLHLYARWEEAVHDFFDGEDRLFLSVTQSGVVYLHREGMEEKTGTYDSQTNIFVFKDVDREVLSGKLFDGQGFYYFNDQLYREFLPYGGGTDRLKLTDSSHATFSSSGNIFNGTYELDPETGNYLFDGGTKQFEFRLVAGPGNTLVYRVKGDEAGDYYGQTSGWLRFDGFGGFVGSLEGVDVAGLYMLDATRDNMLYIMVRDSYNIVTDYFYARYYPEDSLFVEDDGLQGSYTSTSGGTLTLDGFGLAEYNGQSMKYTVGYYGWYYVSGWDMDVYTVTEITVGDAVGILIDNGNGVQFIPHDADALYGMIDVANGVTVDKILYSDAFLFCYGNGVCDVWATYGVTDEGYGVYIAVLTGATVAKEGDVVTVSKEVEEDDDYSMSFTLQDGKLRSPEQTITVDAERKLTIKDGYAYLDGVEIDFYTEPGLYYVYNFRISGNNWASYVCVDDGESAAFAKATIYDEYFVNLNRQGDWLLCLVKFGERWAVGVYTSSDVFAYTVIGTCTEIEGSSDEYTFTMTENNATQSVLDMCSQFRFRLRSDGTFERYDNALQVDNLILDGYGKATYNGKTGTYYYENNILVVQVGSDEYRMTADALTQLSNEAGEYILADDGTWDFNQTLAFDGKGGFSITMAEYYAKTDRFTGAYVAAHGTYDKIKKSESCLSGNMDGFDEYCLTFTDDAPFYGVVENKLYVAVSRVQSYGFTYGVFMCRVPFAVFDSEVEGGGSLYCNGYGEPYYEARYTDADGNEYSGSLVRCDLNDRVYEDRDYTENAEGGNVIFSVYDGNVLTAEFIFDVKDGKVTRRMQVSGGYVLVSETERTDTVMYLDGYGNATLYNGSTLADSGKVSQTGEQFVYASDSNDASKNFVYRLYAVPQVGGYLYEFRKQQTSEQKIYVDEQWQVLILDGYGLGRYITRFGVVQEGEYVVADGILAVFYPDEIDAKTIYFRLDGGSFSVDTSEFVSVGSNLYGYQGSKTTVTLPDDILTVKKRAFYDSDVEQLDLNNVTAVETEAFYRSDLKTVTASKLTTVAARAFAYCEYLASADLPKVTMIGEQAFYQCKRLRSIKLTEIEQIGAYAFTHEEMSDDTIKFDLTECLAPDSVKVDANAFVGMTNNVKGGMVHLRLVVADISTVNKLYTSSVWGGAGKYAQLDYDSKATLVRYLDFSDGKLYATVCGTFAVSVATAADPFEVWGDVVAIYGNKTVYFLKADGSGYEESGVTFGSAVAGEGHVLIAENAEHTFTCSGGKTGTFAFTLTVTYSQSTQKHHYEYAVIAKYDGTDVISARYIADSHAIFCKLSDTEFATVTMTSATECNVAIGGREVKLKSDDGSELTIRYDAEEHIAEVSEFRFKGGLKVIVRCTVLEDGTIELRTGDSERPDIYRVTVNQDSIIVSHYGKVHRFNTNENGSADYDDKVYLVVDDDGNVIGFEKFVYQKVEMTVKNVTINSSSVVVETTEGTYLITVTDLKHDYVTIELQSNIG